jgi:hypothetical protein
MPVSLLPVVGCPVSSYLYPQNTFSYFLIKVVMDQPPQPPALTPAERYYEAAKRASKAYYRRKHPNPRPVGRPRKVAPDAPEPPKTDSAV